MGKERLPVNRSLPFNQIRNKLTNGHNIIK